jgi:hypothetical protein
MKSQYLKSGLVTDIIRCEKASGQDWHSNVFQSPKGHGPDVFQAVATLDELDRVLPRQRFRYAITTHQRSF